MDIIHVYLKHIADLEIKNNKHLDACGNFNRDIESRINSLQNAIVNVLHYRGM